jgi:hypothetical protein
VTSPRGLVASPYRRGVLALALVALLWRAWTVSRWTWQDDDWLYLADAHSMGWWEYLFQDYNAHLMPAQFLLTKIITLVDPLDFTSAVVLVSLGSAGMVLAWGRALAEIAGERVALLAPLSMITLTPLLLRPTMWWASALQVVPLQISMALLVLAAAQQARRPNRRTTWGLVGALILGLAFWEKALLCVIPAVAVLLHLTPGSLRARVRANVKPVAALAIVSVAYLGLYAALINPEDSDKNMGVTMTADRSAGQVVEFYLRGIGDLLSPALLGGPWGSMPLAADSFARPPAWVAWSSTLLVAAVVVALAQRSRGAWLPIAMAASYLVLSWGLVLFSVRFDHMQMRAVNDERYHVDNFSVAVLAGVLLVASAGGVRARLPHKYRRPLVGFLGACVAVSLVVGNVLGAQRIGPHPGKAWVDNVTDEVRVADAPLVLVDANTPDEVLSPVFFPDYARLSRVLSPYGDQLHFGSAAERLRVSDPRGVLHPVDVDVQSRSKDGPDPGCGYAVGPGSTVEVPVTEPLFFWDWVIQVNTLSGDGGSLRLDVGDTSSVIPVVPGLSQQQVQVVASVEESITLTSSEESGTTCVSEVLIGNPGTADR